MEWFSHAQVISQSLPPKHNLNFMHFFVRHCISHEASYIFLLIQKRGSRKGSIEIKKIRCVEKVNLEEQTPVERQYPFQVRGKITFHWMDGCSFSIFYYELSIERINKDTAKWFIKMMACAYIYVTIDSILNLSLWICNIRKWELGSLLKFNPPNSLP